MTVTTSTPQDTIDLILTVGDSFISSTGKKFFKGDIYTLPKDEANKLMSVKGDYDIRFFKKSDGVGKKAIPENMETKEVLPSVLEMAKSSNEESKAQYEKALAADKANAIASATRGQGDEEIEKQLATKARIASVGPTSEGMGEIDTATSPKGRGRPANAVMV